MPVCVCQAQQTDNHVNSPVDILSSDFNANRISPTRPSSVTSPAPRVIRIVRAPGTGLGISIAGGRGSVPFIGTDEVMIPSPSLVRLYFSSVGLFVVEISQKLAFESFRQYLRREKGDGC